MIFEKPLVEFVAVNPDCAVSTSGGTGGTDTCNGPTSIQRNCGATGDFPSFAFSCGEYIQGEQDANWTPGS